MKRIVFSDQAKLDIRAIPQHVAMNILKAIRRVGDYRVRFTEEPDTLRIHAVKNRKDAYR